MKLNTKFYYNLIQIFFCGILLITFTIYEEKNNIDNKNIVIAVPGSYFSKNFKTLFLENIQSTLSEKVNINIIAYNDYMGSYINFKKFIDTNKVNIIILEEANTHVLCNKGILVNDIIDRVIIQKLDKIEYQEYRNIYNKIITYDSNSINNLYQYDQCGIKILSKANVIAYKKKFNNKEYKNFKITNIMDNTPGVKILNYIPYQNAIFLASNNIYNTNTYDRFNILNIYINKVDINKLVKTILNNKNIMLSESDSFSLSHLSNKNVRAIEISNCNIYNYLEENKNENIGVLWKDAITVPLSISITNQLSSNYKNKLVNKILKLIILPSFIESLSKKTYYSPLVKTNQSKHIKKDDIEKTNYFTASHYHNSININTENLDRVLEFSSLDIKHNYTKYLSKKLIKNENYIIKKTT